MYTVSGPNTSTFPPDVINDPLNWVLPVTRNEPVMVAVPINGNADPVGAQLADVAKEALVALLAQLLVPNNEPVNLPVNDPVNDPVLICADDDTIPVGNIVGANEAETANDDVKLFTTFRNTFILPVTFNEPDNTC